MGRKITSEETNQLFSFCHKHYVYHYDLQVELVDHLASAIEEQYEKNPDLAFEQALRSSFGKFGITGFSKIKDQKQKELARKYNQSWALLFVSFLIVGFNLVLFGYFFYIPKKVKEHFNQQFPEFAM